MRRFALLFATAAVLLSGAPSPAADVPNDRDSVEHALNRLAYGPRPGDVDRVRQLGLDTWIERQLNPSRIDDAALDARLPKPAEPPAQFSSQQEARQFGRQSVQALAAAKVSRAVYSERQLQEVMVDFWFNHFNVFAGKGITSLYIPAYERDAIRPHVFGRFRDLLGATAHSPAMLFYLDNAQSVSPDAPQPRQQQQQQQQQGRRRGLNENYARELLELHTLGVDGGYTQQDIVNVARAFTGWGIVRPQAMMMADNAAAQGQAPAGRQQRARQAAGRARRGSRDDQVSEGGFRFAPMMHDRGEKTVLGTRIPAGGGIEDGERVLDLLAKHPSTARHIATKLVRRFVADEPPEALVARVAARFRDTDGDLREVVRAVITSPEFFAAEHRRAKVKTPLEFVVSALRETGRELPDMRVAVRGLQQLGMMPYGCEPPTGYDDTGETWISAGALVARMNMAQQLAPQRAAVIGGPEFQKR